MSQFGAPTDTASVQGGAHQSVNTQPLAGTTGTVDPAGNANRDGQSDLNPGTAHGTGASLDQNRSSGGPTFSSKRSTDPSKPTLGEEVGADDLVKTGNSEGRSGEAAREAREDVGGRETQTTGTDRVTNQPSGGEAATGNEAQPTSVNNEELPEQLHAGKVGYGPNYHRTPGLGDKVAGFKEEVKGKITKNPDLAHHGHDLRTGELQRKEAEADQSLPFEAANEDQSAKTPSSTNPSTATSGSEHTNTAGRQGDGVYTGGESAGVGAEKRVGEDRV